MLGRLTRARALLLSGVSLAACVPTAEKRAGNPESAVARLPDPAPASAAGRLTGTPGAEPEQRPPARPGQRWIAGYWHWDGVRHVWIGGHWEDEHAAYTWQPDAAR